MKKIELSSLKMTASTWGTYTVWVEYRDSSRKGLLLKYRYTTPDFNNACDKFKEWTKI